MKNTPQGKIMKKSAKKILALMALGMTFAQAAAAAALTENVVFDLTDVNFIFGGLVVAGVSLYAIRKAKGLLGA